MIGLAFVAHLSFFRAHAAGRFFALLPLLGRVMSSLEQVASRNLILSRMSAEDFALLQPHLEHISLKLRQRLEMPNKAISHVVFPETGIISVVARGTGDRHIEVGIIGREGMTGIPVVMGTDRSPNDTYVQGKGDGWRIAADDLRKAMKASPSMMSLFQLFTHLFLIQASYTALANGRATIDERLARWLLMAQERMDGDKLMLTHEFLATMLGVRRAGVTIAIGTLVAEGLIASSRGMITILDNKALLKRTNGYFGAPEREYRRIFA